MGSTSYFLKRPPDAARGKRMHKFSSRRWQLSLLLGGLLTSITVVADPQPFNIEAEDAPRALLEFGRQSSLQILFASEKVKGVLTNAVHGSYEPIDALNLLLKGTVLGVKQKSDGVLVIERADRSVGKTASASPTLQGPAASVQLAQAPAASVAAEQSVPLETPTQASEKDQLNEIVVTGTHIRGISPSSPVITISSEDIERSGYTSVGDLMRSLPQNYGGGNSPQTTTGAAPGLDNGASYTGGSSPNLRGLGSGSTLTLVNGQRLADDTTNGAVDITLIPLAAIQRVEVVTDGASAAYGSDAVAGVVNIILKKDYSGSQTSILGGATSQGGGTEKQINQLLGKTWASGNLLFDYEFDRVDPIYSTARDYTLEAGTPTTLYPGTSRDSFFLSGNRNFGDRVSGFVDALYTYRIERDALSFAGEDLSTFSETMVHQYSATLGLDVRLPGNWRLRPAVDLTEERGSINYATIPYYFSPNGMNEGRTRSFEAVADGALVALPAGALRSAIGAGYRTQTYAVLGQDFPPTLQGERRVKYAYAEVAVPLFTPAMGEWIRKLELNVSGREEHYSDFGEEGVPKVGLAYEPADSVKLRATWGKSYRAPPLYALYGEKTAFLEQIPNPASSTGTSPALLESGGNASLRPETAKTWTAGIDYDPKWLMGLHLSATYYDIAYLNRIGEIPTFYGALTDPLFAPFVTRAPSAALQQSVLNAVGPDFYNQTGSPYVPNDVAALINAEQVNVSRQEISGVDLTANYKRPISKGSLEIFANATYLDLRQQFVPLAPEVEISGQAFEPSKIRTRAGSFWAVGPFGLTGIVNFTGSELNPYQPGNAHVASWTTFDVQLSFRPQLAGLLAGFQTALSVQNVLDRNPPFVLFDQYVPGLHYDPTNASVLGRFISLRLSKDFK